MWLHVVYYMYHSKESQYRCKPKRVNNKTKYKTVQYCGCRDSGAILLSIGIAKDIFNFHLFIDNYMIFKGYYGLSRKQFLILMRSSIQKFINDSHGYYFNAYE